MPTSTAPSIASYPIWRGENSSISPLNKTAYRYSPVAIVPGLSLNTNVNTQLASYGDGTSQSTVSLSQRGPTLTLGTFSKPFLDYTQLSISGSATLKNGSTVPSISIKQSTWAPLALASPNRLLAP